MSGHSLQHMHRYAEARAAYRRSLELNPNFTPAQHDLASLPN
jgi:Tetratricopeptide repeat